MVVELCKKYLEQKEYCDKLQYLSKYDYDDLLINERLDAWVELISIRGELARKLILPKEMRFYEQD